MQRGKGHGTAYQTHGFQYRLGGQHTGAAHLNDNIFQHRGLLLRWVLVGHRPAGALGSAAQYITLAKIIQLNDGTVNIEGVLLPLLAKTGDLGEDLLFSFQTALRDHLKVLSLQIFNGLGMGLEAAALTQLQVEDGNVQLALGGDAGIQLAQGACGGIAGIGHQGLPLDLAAGIDLLKHAAGHIDLATDDEAGQLLRQGHGQRADGAEILRHILTHAAIAAGGAAVEHTVAVLHRHTEAVHLGLHAEGGMGQFLTDAGQKGLHFVGVKHILQALQRHVVTNLFELAQNLAADTLGGRIGRHFLGMLCLQFLQTAQETVIFKIGHGGSIQYIVQVACLIERCTQLFDFTAIIHSKTSF